MIGCFNRKPTHLHDIEMRLILPLATRNGILAALDRPLWVEHHQPAASRSGRGPTCVPHRQRWHGKRSAPAGEADTTTLNTAVTNYTLPNSSDRSRSQIPPTLFFHPSISADRPISGSDGYQQFRNCFYGFSKRIFSNLRKWRPQKIGYPVLIEEKRSMELGESDPGTSHRWTKGNLWKRRRRGNVRRRIFGSK
jgi:hypothetical protein